MFHADRPTTELDLEYHTHTAEGDLSPLCLIVGAPGRAHMIAAEFLTGLRCFKNDLRGLTAYTGLYRGSEVSVVTSGMGGPSMGIVLPEAVRSGARIFIRVGSCGSLIKESRVGDVIVVTKAIRFDGASQNWAMPEFPAAADDRVVTALRNAAAIMAPERHHVGIESSTSDFNAGQARPNLFGIVPPHMQARHEEMLRLGVACYSMEAAALFVWCDTEGGGLPAGAINAVFGNRLTNEWGTEGEELAAAVALGAFRILAEDKSMADYIARRQPVYPAK